MRMMATTGRLLVEPLMDTPVRLVLLINICARNFLVVVIQSPPDPSGELDAVWEEVQFDQNQFDNTKISHPILVSFAARIVPGFLFVLGFLCPSLTNWGHRKPNTTTAAKETRPRFYKRDDGIWGRE